MNKIILECTNVAKNFQDGKNSLQILKDLNLQIYAGQQIAIIGQSGCGKSTLLQILGGLDKPSAGSVCLDGQDINLLSVAEQSALRSKKLGFIYQFHHLLPEFTALENVAIPMLIAQQSLVSAALNAQALLEDVGLLARAHHKPAQLSGGERQRVAIARALANNPVCVLADEPTGNLDPESAELVFQAMQSLNQKYKTTFVIVTHDLSLAKKLDLTYSLQNSTIVKI
jgi:lipoprotein-releasing system ATP-binding protein